MKFTKLKDSEIVSLVNTELDEAVEFFDSKIASNRKENQSYYDSEAPEQKQRGRSKFISGDVFDVVETLKASLLETFSGNRTIVEFLPQKEEDVEPARIATEYTNYVFYRQNDGYSILQDVIHDGLLNRIGVVKAYWKKDSVNETYTFNNLTGGQIVELQQDPELKDVEWETEDIGGIILYSGNYVKTIDTSRVVVEPLAPEEFLITHNAKSTDKARVVAHRARRTISGLIKEGVDKKLAIEAYKSASNKERPTDDEVIELDYDGADEESPQKQTEDFWVYESYIELDVEGTGEASLWKITTAGDVILDKEEVDSRPFFVFSPLATPHALIGTDLTKRLKPIQNAKTTIVRSVLDHTVITNNPRMQVVKGTLANPRELLDNRLGGIVNTTRPDGLLPIPQSPMNPYVFNTIQLMDDNKEQTTGVSRLSQGLNKDAISKQNSNDMVGNLVTLSQQRQKTIARNLGEKFLKPLFVYIYKLVLENETKTSIIEVAGNYVPVDPSKWIERKDATVQFTIGYQEVDKEVQDLVGIAQMLKEDPVMARGFDYGKRYNFYKKILEKKGIKDIQNYLIPPDKLPEPKPSPMEVLQLKQMEQALDINERQTRSMERSKALEEYELLRKSELNETKTEADILAKADKSNLDKRKFSHSVRMDMFEKAIVEQKARQGDISASANVTTGGA